MKYTALTQELSGRFVIRGENWETGSAGPLPPCTGEPKPAIPETLYRLVAPFVFPGSGGRVCGTGGAD